MPLKFWKKLTKKMTPLEKDVANAITHYNQTVQEDDNCNLCKAYLMYQNVLNSFKKVQEKYNAQMEEHCRRSVGHFVQQIDNAKN